MQLYTKILIGMAIGVVLGILVGPNSFLLPQDAVQLGGGAQVVSQVGGDTVPMASGVKHARIVETAGGGGSKPDMLRLEWTLTPKQVLAQKAKGIQGGKPGETYSGWVEDTLPGARKYASIGQMLVDGTEWIGRLFLAMIKMVVVPLVFCSLTVGVASLGDFRKLGRLGGRTLGFFLGTTVVALTIGVGLANLIQPGKLMSEKDRLLLLSSYQDGAASKVGAAADAPSFVDQLVGIVPTNPLASLAGGDMLQIIFFALMFGIALTMLETSKSQIVVDVVDRCNDAMVMLVHIAMKLAPVGVAALLFKVVGTTGMSVLGALIVYALVVVLGLTLHVMITYAFAIKFGAKLPVLGFISAIKPALLVAFSTSSSSATLPVTMQCCEDNVNVKGEVTSFVLPLGATVNMDGTALYQGVAAIFIAQIYGMDLGIAEQVTIVVSATLASVGAAGVPGAGMITLAMVLTAIGVPTEGLALVLGVDRILDMFRTTCNVVGDSTACALMGRLEGNDLQLLTAGADAADPTRGFEGRVEVEPHKVAPRDEV